MKGKKVTQEQQVIEVLRRAGGYATLRRLNELVDFSSWTTKTPEASVRRKKEYEDKLHVSMFSPIENRVKFLNYKQVVDLYEGLKKVDGSLW